MMDEEVEGGKSQIGELTSSNEARVSDLVEVNAALQLHLETQDAEWEAAVDAEGKRGRSAGPAIGKPHSSGAQKMRHNATPSSVNCGVRSRSMWMGASGAR
jgi:hypothetical protein